MVNRRAFICNTDCNYTERTALLRVAQHFAGFIPLLIEAERVVSKKARVKFNYAQFRRDLDRMQHQVLEHAQNRPLFTDTETQPIRRER